MKALEDPFDETPCLVARGKTHHRHATEVMMMMMMMIMMMRMMMMVGKKSIGEEKDVEKELRRRQKRGEWCYM